MVSPREVLLFRFLPLKKPTFFIDWYFRIVCIVKSAMGFIAEVESPCRFSRSAARPLGRIGFYLKEIMEIGDLRLRLVALIVGCILLAAGGTPGLFADEFTEENVGRGSEDLSIVQACSKFYGDHYRLIFLVEDAKKRGITVSQQEIGDLLKEYGRLCPSGRIDEQMAQDELLAQKYLESMVTYSVSNADISDAFTGLFPPAKTVGRIKPEEIESLLKTMVLLSREGSRELIEQIRVERETKAIRDIHRFGAFWPKDSLCIIGNNNECIATNPADGKCLITIGQYNDRIRFYPVFKESTLDSGRICALRSMLEDLYYVNQAEISGFAHKDSARILMDRWKLRWIWSESRRSLGPLEFDERLLKSAYSKYYDYRFRKYSELFVSILGSTDSNQVDFLLKRALMENVASDSLTKAGLNSSKPSLAWAHCRADSLESALARVASGFQIGDISKPISTPYGWFIIRLDSGVVHPAISFDDARNKLIVLATREKWQNVDSLLLDQAYRIYKANPGRYCIPDTLMLRIWLWSGGSDPGLVRGALRPSGAGHKTVHPVQPIAGGDTTAPIDTLTAPSVTAVSTQLPSALTAIVNTGYANTPVKKVVLGPFQTKYGTFAFKVTAIKRGGKNIPFASVKWHIFDSLMAVSSDSVRFTAAEDSLFGEIALANSYKAFLFEQIKQDLSEETESPENKSTLVDASAQEADAGRAFQQNEIRKAASWMKTLSINPAFFKRR
jgi:hypothetical protein